MGDAKRLRKAPTEPDTVALNSQLVGNVGLYYCCYRLSLLGWNVMPTARNARGVDIIAYNKDASQFKGIQVKTLSKHVGVPLGRSIDNLMGDFWVVVVKAKPSSPESFVLTPEEVKERALRQVSKENGTVSFWLSRNEYNVDQFRDAWSRIGTERIPGGTPGRSQRRRRPSAMHGPP